jgi:Family of unknown function (DUF6077)
MMKITSRLNLETALRISCAGVVVLFGSWTVLANAIVLTGNSFADLERWTPLALLAAAAILAYLVFDNTFERTEPFANAINSPEEGPSKNALVHLLIGAGLAAVFAFEKQYLLFWILSVLYLGGVYLQGWRGPAPQAHASSSHYLNHLTFALAVIIAVFAACLFNRPDADDSLYINMAVSVLDNPHSPIFATDTLQGIPGAYLLPTYRAHSYELLAALVTKTFHAGEPIKVLHLVFDPLFSLFSVLAAALCLQKLLPKWWGWACLVLTLEYLTLRGTHTMYGNFAYVRMFQGKSIFITAIIPLIVVYAADFFARPRAATWFLLLAAQICAVGFTANSLYAAPLAAGLTLVACWSPSLPAIRRLGLGLLASFYPVMIGLMIRAIVVKDGLLFENFQQFIPIDEATNLVLGNGVTLWLWLTALTCTWCLIRDIATRQWVLGFCLAFMLICMNPFLDEYWGTYVTAKYLTWRLFWAVPLPIFFSIFIIQGFANGTKWPPGRSHILGLVTLTLLVILVLGKPWIDPNPVDPAELRLGLKVPQPQYSVAKRLSEIAGAENLVVAPEDVSTWVPTFRGHAYPLVARFHYSEALLSVFAGEIDVKQVQERLVLSLYVNGSSENNQQAETLLQEWVAAKKLSAIAVLENFGQIHELSKILGHAGWVPEKYLGYLIFH